jgi:hypothetical protein
VRLLALDPGTTRSGWVLLDGTDVRMGGKDPNESVLVTIGQYADLVDELVIEQMGGAFDGSPFGNEKIEACRWLGRFEQAATGTIPVIRISRGEVKLVLLGKANARHADTLLRAVIIDRYAAIAGDPLGGKAAAIGLKARPGPLHGVRADVWAALAVALARMGGARDIERERADQAKEKAEAAAKKAGRAA